MPQRAGEPPSANAEDAPVPRWLFVVAASIAWTAAPTWGDGVRLLPAQVSVPVGAQAHVELVLESEAGTLGGALQLEFDGAVLELASIEFDDATGEPDFRCPTHPAANEPIPCPADGHFVSFGAFGGIPAGTHTIATLTFDALAPGQDTVSASVASPFADPLDLGAPLSVSIEGANVIVPEGGSVALATLLLATGWLGRRRSA